MNLELRTFIESNCLTSDFRRKNKKLESPTWRKRQFDTYVENTLKRSGSGRLNNSFRKPGLVPGMFSADFPHAGKYLVEFLGYHEVFQNFTVNSTAWKCENFIKDANNIATKFSTESQSDNEVNYNSGANSDIFTITKVSPVKRSKTR